jgi:inorganic phosphate transporter, PiT family
LGRYGPFSEDGATLNNYGRFLDDVTKLIPFSVEIAVSIALGLGTMIGRRRIAVTVGEDWQIQLDPLQGT